MRLRNIATLEVRIFMSVLFIVSVFEIWCKYSYCLLNMQDNFDEYAFFVDGRAGEQNLQFPYQPTKKPIPR